MFSLRGDKIHGLLNVSNEGLSTIKNVKEVRKSVLKASDIKIHKRNTSGEMNLLFSHQLGVHFVRRPTDVIILCRKTASQKVNKVKGYQQHMQTRTATRHVWI
ncbi:unnamed protein product [Calicophoron daubneyi]|uniref:Uncharacterized protein n=1 Tax=Calicophoron daubneyi TaxID=300641 RepID=A0AAV2TMC4_CALDB